MLDDEFLSEFGFKIKMFRIKCGLTQAQLGEMVNISEHRISEIECGKCNLTLKSINRFSNALNIHPHNLFDFE